MVSKSDPIILELYRKITRLEQAQAKPLTVDRPGGLGCIVYRNSTQSFTTDVLKWNTIYKDTSDGQMWASGHPERLVAPATGWYVFGASWQMASGQITASGWRLAMYLQQKNVSGTAIANYNGQVIYTQNGKDMRQSSVGIAYMLAGEWIEVPVSQDSGSAKDITAAISNSFTPNHGWIYKIG